MLTADWLDGADGVVVASGWRLPVSTLFGPISNETVICHDGIKQEIPSGLSGPDH